MILMQLHDISKSFGAEQILSKIKIEVKERDRIAIVGKNGAGKSTLLKIMAGELSYDEGEIFKQKDLSIGYLPQHTALESVKTIWEEMLDVFETLRNQEKQLRQIEHDMAHASHLSPSEYKQLLQTYDQLQQSFEKEGGYRYEADIKTVLTGLNFPDPNIYIHELSGGQKTRLALGKLLLQKPDILILDEPTNHLDIETLTWLENYLQNYPGAIVIVSHDRYFLDKTVSIVYEISRHKSKKYFGTYSDFLEQRQEEYERQLKEYEKQQTDIQKMEAFIQRNIARASTTKRAQSRRKQLEKMERIERPLGQEPAANFSFQIKKRSGNDVLKVKELSFRYEDTEEPLFSNITFQVNRGERVALVGPNGVGKTTLLKILIGKLTQETGHVQLGTNVEIGYYDQEQTELSSHKTVLNELWDDYPTTPEQEIRTILGRFLFSGDDVLKPVYSLSGGEKARLALAKLMMQQANLLILDEPTNHLDLDSKEVLEAALQDFPGTIIFVSHDRYFINKITDQVLEMNQDGITVYLGDYDYYVAKKQEQAEREKLAQATIETFHEEQDRKKLFELEKQLQREKRRKEREISKIEEDITVLEEQLEEVELSLTQPEVYQDHEKAFELSQQADELRQRIEALMEQWELLQEDSS